ncbi:hypothetical protein JTB14_022599 [Gonioctena quinquepunctata]|nr:hypothetical protein JTB14_022599 [Gonioctena quinquepunctata]
MFHLWKKGKEDCWFRKDATNENTKRANSLELEGNMDACVGELLTVRQDHSSRINSDEWFMDSGASDHMTNRIEWFQEYNLFISLNRYESVMVNVYMPLIEVP